MYARLTFLKLKHGRAGEAKSTYASSVLPAARKQRGFLKLYWLEDEESGDEAISFSLWESKEAALDNEGSGFYRDQLRKFDQLYLERPIRKGYEVRVEG